MRLKLSIALCMFFIAFLAVTALSADWDNQQSLSADELISGVEKNSKTPMTPQQSRALQENKSSMDWSMPSTLSGSAKDPKASRAEAEAASSEAKEESSAPTNSIAMEENASIQAQTTELQTTELPPAEVSMPSLGGSWSFTLNDSMQRNVALTLFQNNSEIFGAGKMRVENSTIDAAVSGQVYGNETAKLDITTMNPITLYTLYLRLNGDMASGNHTAVTASGESLTGTFQGLKIA